ncbi:MAG: DUF2851 family protein [Bacteroidales bacterium]
MKEEFLHYLWKYRLYDPDLLTDSMNNRIIVIHPGEYNRDSGPDFFNARISVEGTEWAGNVEIHTRSSHFEAHGHNTDKAFDNVILHVVAVNDREVFNSRGEPLLTAELKYDDLYYEKYTDLINNPSVIACQDEIRSLDRFLISHWLHSLLIERLQEKSGSVMKIFSETGNDWDETFYRILARYFGFRVNTGPFEMLASALPFKIIRKHADNVFQIEALLFGTAGMLDEGLFREALDDSYYRDLINEYRVLSAKYSLQPVHGKIWKFCRLRPVNFPTIRISQLSAILCTAGGLFSRTLDAVHVKQLKMLFGVSASPYWDAHYIFGKKSTLMSKNTGSQASDLLLINAVIPMIFVYGRFHNIQHLTERALSFLECVPAETNAIISNWKSAGVEASSAFFTQGLLQLTEKYCRRRRCLECRIGSKIISMGKSLKNENELILEP